MLFRSGSPSKTSALGKAVSRALLKGVVVSFPFRSQASCPGSTDVNGYREGRPRKQKEEKSSKDDSKQRKKVVVCAWKKDSDGNTPTTELRRSTHVQLALRVKTRFLALLGALGVSRSWCLRKRIITK